MSSKPAQESDKTSLKVVKVVVTTLKLNQSQEGNLNFIVRKAAHFSEYFILSLFITLTYIELFNKKLNISFILLMCILVALSDEYFQSFIPGRASMVRDVFIDFSGSFTQVVVFILFAKYKINKDKRGKNNLKFKKA